MGVCVLFVIVTVCSRRNGRIDSFNANPPPPFIISIAYYVCEKVYELLISKERKHLMFSRHCHLMGGKSEIFSTFLIGEVILFLGIAATYAL